MIKEFLNYESYDINLLLQSTPSLIISLVGLLVTGRILEDGVMDKNIQIYPILLQSNCVLNFLGNVELLYALYLSSMRLNDLITYDKYLRYAFDNANLVILQSITIGVTIGIIGISKTVLSGIVEIKVLANIMATSLVTCATTTIIFILLVYFTIEFSKMINVSPDNVVLPTVSSVSDYVSIRILILFTKYFKSVSLTILILLVLICLCLIPFCLFFICISKKRMPIQSVEVLAFTYVLSTFGGYLLDHLSNKYQFLASSFPVYSGLAVSISFIYLHKIFTSINNNTAHDSLLSYMTLIVTSFVMIIFYMFLSLFFEMRKSCLFYILFIGLFVLQVIILLKMTELLAKFLQNYEGDVGVISLPVITAVGDVISTLFLMIIAFSTSVMDIHK